MTDTRRYDDYLRLGIGVFTACVMPRGWGHNRSTPIESLMPTFGEKLRTLRKRAKLTQRELADQLGEMNQSFIALLEHDKRNPTVEIVLKVSNLFHVTADQLIRDELTLDDPTDTTTKTDETT